MRKNFNPMVILFPAMLILSDAITTADNLSGKFFSPAFSILANFYANDFLIWGIILFSAIGVLVGNIDIKFINNKKWESLVLFVMLTIPLIVIANINMRMYGNEDLRLLGALFQTWAKVFWYSGMLFPVSKYFGIRIDDKVLSSSGI